MNQEDRGAWRRTRRAHVYRRGLVCGGVFSGAAMRKALGMAGWITIATLIFVVALIVVIGDARERTNFRR